MNIQDIINKYWDTWVNHAINVFNDVMETTDSSIFEKYRIFENAGSNEEINSTLTFLQRLAVLCIENGDIKNRLFSSSYHVSPMDFYQISYFLNLMSLAEDKAIQKLFLIAKNIIDSISDRSIIDNPFIPTEVEMELSEDEIFDILTRIPVNLAVNIVGNLNIDRKHKQNIKRFVLSNDLNGFIEYSITNCIDYVQIENICGSLILKNLYKESLNQISEYGVGFLSNETVALPEWNDKKLFDLITERAPEVVREINLLTINADKAIQNLLSKPQDAILDSFWKGIYYAILFTKQLKNLCPNNELIDERDRIVYSVSLFQSVEERFSFADTYNLPNFVIPTIDEFKNHYISEIELPPSCNVKKSSDSFFNGNKMWTNADIFTLYKLLTEEGILSWDEATCFSFMYRMSRLYKPSDEIAKQLLRPIYWNGKNSELISLIFFFHEGETRMWKKCTNYFSKPNGERIKLPSGAVNSAKTISDRMNNILSNKCFRR